VKEETEYVIVGQILREFGREGEIIISIEPVLPANSIKEGKLFVFTKENHLLPLPIERVRKAGGHTFYIKLRGVDCPEIAKKFRGFEIYTKKEYLEKLREGEYYYFEFEGMKVYEDDEEIGEICYIEGDAKQSIFIVKDREGREIMIPAVKEFIKEIDTKRKRMKVRLPEGLREV